MAQKRILRSASKLKSAPTPPPAEVSTNVPSSPEPRNPHSLPATVRDASPETPSSSPSKKRKLQTATVNTNTRPSDNVSFNRPAGPQRTNAPLATPRRSRVVTYNQDMLDGSPSKTPVPPPTTTTSQLLEEACAHLIRVDPRLQPLIEKHHCRLFSPEGLAEVVEPFQSLCSSIMAQQVSGAAASSIKAKFVGLFREGAQDSGQDQSFFPSPAQVASCQVSFLRRAGLSERKAEYIKGLAQKFEDGELTATILIKASDEEIMEKLTAVRGLGLWSVQMFACFALKRTDIFSTGTEGTHPRPRYSSD
ncbi:MAG: hypothetical protein L6R39_000814 [Caloplaca ligustica]|nr:MAG: hypothetical protein L6R39_000814 [Caloplaca ligustica]